MLIVLTIAAVMIVLIGIVAIVRVKEITIIKQIVRKSIVFFIFYTPSQRVY